MKHLCAGAVRGCLDDDAVIVNGYKPGLGLADSKAFMFQVHDCSKDLGFVAGGWVHHAYLTDGLRTCSTATARIRRDSGT